MVFENTSHTVPALTFARATLPVKTQVIYLGTTHRGSWKEHVERRIDKAAKWDGLAMNMLGKTGGPPVSTVATVREATTETKILYGAEFTGGTDTTLLDRANARQIEVEEEILGLRPSADNVGALLELGWSDIETKATQRHLMFWWRLGRTHSELMRRLEWQAHQRNLDESVEERKYPYNWWRYTDKLVANIARQVKRRLNKCA